MKVSMEHERWRSNLSNFEYLWDAKIFPKKGPISIIMVEPTVLNSDVKTNLDIKLQIKEVTPLNCMTSFIWKKCMYIWLYNDFMPIYH